MKIKLHCDTFCHKAGRIYHHRGFKSLLVVILLLLVLKFKGEPVTLVSFLHRAFDLGLDLYTARTLKV